MASSNPVPGIASFGVFTGRSVRVSVRKLIALPTSSGWMFATLTVLLLIGAINFQNNLGFLLAFGLITVGFLSLLRSGFNLSDIKLQLDHIEPLEAESKGQTITLHIQAEGIREGLMIRPRWPAAETQWIKRLNTDQRLDILIPSFPRGTHALPDIEFGSVYPFGWVMLRGKWNTQQKLTVYPRPLEPKSKLSSRAKGIQTELAVREYRAGDKPSQIAWKKSKSVNHLVTRIQDRKSHQEHVSDTQYHDLPKETVLSHMAWEVLDHFANDRSWSFELGGVIIERDSSKAHRDRCLKALADA